MFLSISNRSNIAGDSLLFLLTNILWNSTNQILFPLLMSTVGGEGHELCCS